MSTPAIAVILINAETVRGSCPCRVYDVMGKGILMNIALEFIERIIVFARSV